MFIKEKMVRFLSNQSSSLNKKAIIEALLYAAGKPVKIMTLAKKAKTTIRRTLKIIEKLSKEYNERGSAIEIIFVDDAVVMQLKSEFTPYVIDISPFPFTKTDLKILSLLALKQRTSQVEVIKKVGKHAYTHIKKLEKEGYIVREGKSGTIFLSLTKLSREYFGLSSKNLKERIKEKKRQSLEDLKKYFQKMSKGDT